MIAQGLSLPRVTVNLTSMAPFGSRALWEGLKPAQAHYWRRLRQLYHAWTSPFALTGARIMTKKFAFLIVAAMGLAAPSYAQDQIIIGGAQRQIPSARPVEQKLSIQQSRPSRVPDSWWSNDAARRESPKSAWDSNGYQSPKSAWNNYQPPTSWWSNNGYQPPVSWSTSWWNSNGYQPPKSAWSSQ